MYKKTNLLLTLLLLPASIFASSDLTIDGIINDQVISRVGQLFYEDFVSGWTPPKFEGYLTIKERPDNFAGNVIWIEVNDIIVYEARVGFRPNGIEDKALEARTIVEDYLLENDDILQELEGIK